MSSKNDLLIDSDPDFCKGYGGFDFPNGDQYVGDYCAHRSGIVWREGKGKYRTQDGHIYIGEWKDDKLVEGKPVEIFYRDGVEFYGCIAKNKYEGPGLYIFDHYMALLCDFSNNKPVGELTIIDTKGREWHGIATQDEALLLPEHIYFNNINDSSGKGRRRYIPSRHRKRQSDISFIRSRSLLVSGKQKAKSIVQNAQRSRSLILSQTSRSRSQPKIFEQPTFRVLPQNKQLATKEEAKVFAKTKKTASDLQLENSDWYKNYTNFKAVHDRIKDQIDKDGEASLKEDERNWYGKFMKFKQRYREIMNSRKHKNEKLSKEQLFEMLSSNEFEDKCPPVEVIYATADCGSVCECEIIIEDKEDEIFMSKQNI